MSARCLLGVVVMRKWIAGVRDFCDKNDITVWCNFKWAGILGFSFRRYSFHFLVWRPYWRLGYRHTMEGADLHEWGCGPIFFVCRIDGKT